MIKLPGLIDPHVHMREPGGEHKEDWQSGTRAALAGGFTLVLAMPNTKPPVVDSASFNAVLKLAESKALCDFALFAGAGPDAANLPALAERTAGLKMYLDQTYGPLRLDEMDLWMPHFASWPLNRPLAIHAESRTLAAAVLFAALFDRPVHICHVSKREEILVIKAARERGIPVTCEVTPHHLFLTQEDIPRMGGGFAEVRPVLASRADQQALWDNLDVIDCFASDHAPHTMEEKKGENPPPGFPGLETSLPLLLTAVANRMLTIDDIVQRCYTNPLRIFNLPAQPDTWIEVDTKAKWEIRAAAMQSRCSWTPFEGYPVQGRLERVVLRGKEVFRDGKVLAQPGYGRNIRERSQG